jgi:hypothetical protein
MYKLYYGIASKHVSDKYEQGLVNHLYSSRIKDVHISIHHLHQEYCRKYQTMTTIVEVLLHVLQTMARQGLKSSLEGS